MHLNLSQIIADRKIPARSLGLKTNVLALLDAAADQPPKEQRACARLARKVDEADGVLEFTDTESKLLRACLDHFPGLQGWARIAMENAIWPDEQSKSDLEDFTARYEVKDAQTAGHDTGGNEIAKEA